MDDQVTPHVKAATDLVRRAFALGHAEGVASVERDPGRHGIVGAAGPVPTDVKDPPAGGTARRSRRP